jgi:hypothetical protein
VELTLEGPLFCYGYGGAAWFRVDVCNGGSKHTAKVGQVVRFETDEALVCEASTSEPVAPGACLTVTCSGGAELAVGTWVSVALNPDQPASECGDPDGRTGEAPLILCD